MADETFIHVHAPSLGIVPGEDEQLFNPGTYGLAMCRHLEAGLRAKGYEVPSYNPEDWGWWFQVATDPVRLALQIYSRERDDGALDHAILLNETGGTTFALRRSKRIDRTPHVARLRTDLLDLFEQDAEIEIVAITDEFPLG